LLGILTINIAKLETTLAGLHSISEAERRAAEVQFVV